MDVPFAVIADIVKSRRVADRSVAQLAVERTIAEADERYPLAQRRLTATVGDEFQGVYDDLESVLTSLLLVQLGLPAEVECRFGIGFGDVRAVNSTTSATIEDGPGWWAARAAIDQVHSYEQTRIPHARTWIRAADGSAPDVTAFLSAVNAYLLARDHIVGSLGERAKRLAYGSWLGRSQEELAADEGISQPGVSQALRRAGVAALQVGQRELTRTAPQALR